MTDQYPWYEIVQGDEIEQGDLLKACPVLVPIPELSLPSPDETIVADQETFDVVIMTQSCDLVNDKTKEIILCPHWDLNEAGRIDGTLAQKDVQRQILKGYRYRYAMLAVSIHSDAPMGIRVVDFGRIFTLPKSFIQQFAEKQGKRLRLRPPYREHLSQSFARFFMRVGLPQDINL